MSLTSPQKGDSNPRLSDVEKRIVAAIKIPDEELNRNFIGENRSFEEFTARLRWLTSSLLVWICVQELLTQKDHLTHSHLITEWMHHMVVKFFTYKQGVGLDKGRWAELKLLALTYHKFEKRTTPYHYKAVRDAYAKAGEWNMPYYKEFAEIWSRDPDQAQKVWKEVFPD